MAANNPYPAPSASSSSSSSSPPSPSSSLFYAILPSAVKTHWPRLSPFRRSANTQRRIQDSSSSCPISPPLERNSRASWSALLQRGFVSDGSVSRSPSPSPTPRYPRSVTRDPPEGPEWKFAAQGMLAFLPPPHLLFSSRNIWLRKNPPLSPSENKASPSSQPPSPKPKPPRPFRASSTSTP